MPHAAVARHGSWGAAKDKKLVQLIGQQGPGPIPWAAVARTMGTVSGKQCRERWHEHLRPGLNHDPLTDTEKAAIDEAVLLHGTQWAVIEESFPDRSRNMIKNYSAARRNSAPARCNSARQSSQQHPVCTSGRKRHRPAVVLSEEDEDDAEQDMCAEQPQVTHQTPAHPLCLSRPSA